MKRLLFLAILVSLMVTCIVAQPRKNTCLDTGWRFHLGDVENSALCGSMATSWVRGRMAIPAFHTT